jgi:hypothetical protein
VDDHRAQAGIAQEGDVLREGGLEGVVDHRVAAVLHDDEGTAEAFEPGQRLDERARLGLGDTQGGGVDGAAQSLVGGWHVGVLRCDLVAQVEYAEFSWT